MAEPIPIRILVIDDSEDDRLLYRRTLKKNTEVPYDILEADSGETGMVRIDENPQMDCILLDYSMPGHNGIDVLKRIRENHPFIPVVILTGQGNEHIAVTAMQEGAQNYISKATITPEALSRVVHNAIENCALQKRIHDQRTSLEIFTHALAHDLKEPTRTIRSYTELLAKRVELTPQTEGYFRHVENAAARMQMLIDSVFHYTQLGVSQSVYEECELSVALQEVKDNIAQLINERKAKITSDPLPSLQANHVQVIQLLQNLVSNAIRHGEDGISVHISAAEHPTHWQISVKDNGPGIAAEYLKKIFEPFRRLATRANGQDGAGLGLAICEKIVSQHGGRIWCESAPGKGATFYFTLSKTHLAANEPPVKKLAVTDPAHSAQQ